MVEKSMKVIELPDGVNASLNGQILLIKGPKGEVTKTIKQHDISIEVSNKKILLKSDGDTKKIKKMVGTLTAHIKNMIKGSLQNHVYILKICSGHFPMNASVSGDKFIVKNFLGEKVPRTLKLKSNANLRVEGDLVYVTSTNKETAGQISADIEQLTKRPGYDTRIFQDGIYITNKDGKELK